MSTQSMTRREHIFAFVVDFKRTHDGNSPSIRQIMWALGINSTSLVNYHLHALERAGRIRLPADRNARGIEIVAVVPPPPPLPAPVVRPKRKRRRASTRTASARRAKAA